MNPKPPLLLDVDGVINVLGAGAEAIIDRGLVPIDATAHDGSTYRLLIAPETPGLLTELSEVFEVVWCTTWRNANEAISPIVDLPRDLRQVWFPTEWHDVPLSILRKTPHVRRWAHDNGVTRLAWIDDEIRDVDALALTATSSEAPGPRGWQQILAGTRALDDVYVIETAPGIGITAEHAERLIRWAHTAPATATEWTFNPKEGSPVRQ